MIAVVSVRADHRRPDHPGLLRAAVTLVVWLCFAPLFLSLRYFQPRLSEAYGVVRSQVGVMLGDLRARRGRGRRPLVRHREYPGPDRHRRRPAPGRLDPGAGADRVLVLARRCLGRARQRRRADRRDLARPRRGDAAGKVLAFAFLVTLFVGPVQMGTQVLTDAQNAIAGWRRVIGILETPADVVDPGDGGGAAAAPGLDRVRRRGVRLPRGAAGAARRVPADRARPPGRGGRGDRLGQDHPGGC